MTYRRIGSACILPPAPGSRVLDPDSAMPPGYVRTGQLVEADGATGLDGSAGWERVENIEVERVGDVLVEI